MRLSRLCTTNVVRTRLYKGLALKCVGPTESELLILSAVELRVRAHQKTATLHLLPSRLNVVLAESLCYSRCSSKQNKA